MKGLNEKKVGELSLEIFKQPGALFFVFGCISME